jgi:integrase
MKVTIENLEGRLRLRWTCPETGKRKNLALGLNDGISGRGEAARVKALIETDAQHGYYDPTLTKYLPPKKRQQVTGITTVELFDRFTQYQQKHENLSKASIETRYKYLKVMLEKHLNIRAADVNRGAIDGFLLVCRKIKPDTAKQRIWLLKRKPYTTRKTSVRHSLLSGANYIEVAAAAGHDPHTMHKYYGDAIQQISVLRAFE